ncbi:MAG: restriction endonuclease subunit M [Bacteroidetes bacterium HGW-Bacteroidetes-3]|nr:MAG: restriction endonuclease subunit M [Bacteroidetes bacterium HGW-Bacteroidetes-3]
MPLFQSSVVTKHLKTQNKENISAMWNAFKAHFHNPAIQENIRNSKEEQYQGEFLIDLFVNVLGYIKNPTPNFNITTEYKNVKDSKKADGAIVVDEVVKAVIELKGTNTTDLGKIEVQAFGYKNNQPECTYVITSNFEKLRFYIDNAIEHIEFNLFTLTEKDFELLYLCLAFENIQNDIPKNIKKESVSQEDAITKKLYNDYSLFKRELHQSLVILNPQFDALTLFQKSQKLLDRFLFLFFAEDRQLLPPNSVRLILEQWVKLKDLDAYTPLFDRFKKYFGYLNTGYKGKQYDVYAYNGGLFKADAVLDTITIDDDLLYKHTLKLSEYDFDSEVDVNILGHIFENSLNELDEIKAQLEGQVIDKSKTKRKKDGVFYTPKYITKYIVENTVGKLCEEKKVELEIVEDDYNTDKKRQKKTIKGLIDKLTDYRNWLLQITICDPACGSGAFLNQALDFLITEHKYIDELQAKLFGDAMVLSDVEKGILENNLFGVDLNEESVEIAKLSLWLRTAQPSRKLNDLNNNIKCGNSLIDDTEIVGDKAFNWQKEFPQIFANGGFDVVIGNPPYVRNVILISVEKDFFLKNYESAYQQYDLYVLFTELGLRILKYNSYLSFIIPNKFIATNYGLKNRKHIIENTIVNEIKDVSDENIFVDASVYPVIINLKKKTFEEVKDKQYDLSIFKINANDSSFINKIESNSTPLINLVTITETIHTGNIREKLIVNEYINSNCKPLLRGRDLDRYQINPDESLFVNFDINLVNKHNGEYANLTSPKLYENEKIFIRDISLRLQAYYDLEKYYSVNTLYSILLIEKNIDYKTLLALLNSELISFWFKSKFNDAHVSGGYLRFKKKYVSQIPINIPLVQQPFIEKADKMLSLNKELQETSQKFQRALEREFNLDGLPKKLQDWYLLSYGEFIKELEKKKVKLSLSQKGEWEDYFLQESKKALALKTNIDTTDKEIDQMVYELYGLTNEEIEIVEKG